MAEEGKGEEGASAGSALSGHSGVCPGGGVSRNLGLRMGGAAGGGFGLCALQHVPWAAGTARAQLAGSEPPPVCALALCVPGRVAGSGFESLCPPPPPSPSVPLYPLPGLSLCPRLSWGRGMLLPAGVTVNPVGRRPAPSTPCSPDLPQHVPLPRPRMPRMPLFWGCILRQSQGIEVTPGDPQMHQKPGFGPVALGRIHFSPVRPPIRSGPQGRKREGGPPCGRGGRGVPWQEGKWKEKLGSTRAGGQAASWPPGQAAVTRAHWSAGPVCAWVELTPGYSWGAAGSPLGAKSGSSGGPQREELSTRVLTPPPGGLAPAPRPRPPGPPSHPRARCSAGGGIGWGRGAEAAAGTTSLPAASLCARGASGGGERASEQQPERGGESERVGEGARRRPRLRSARLPATLPSAARRARRPAAAPAATATATAGAPPPAVAGRGLVGTGVPAWGLGHPGAAERRAARGGRHLRRSARSLNCVGGRAVGLGGAPKGRAPRLLRGSPKPVERPERARPSRTGPCAHPPRTPLLHKLF